MNKNDKENNECCLKVTIETDRKKVGLKKSEGPARQTVQTDRQAKSPPSSSSSRFFTYLSECHCNLYPILVVVIVMVVCVVVIMAVLAWLVRENKCWVSENKGPTRCL